MEEDKSYFATYTKAVMNEMFNRDIDFQVKLANEIMEFCHFEFNSRNFPEHNEQYFTQCYFNLQEKYDRGIISQEEFKKVQEVWVNEERKRFAMD